MTDHYVCVDHPETALANVRRIRPEIGRPEGISVIGECEDCQSKMLRHRNVQSYGKRPTSRRLPHGDPK